MGLVLPVLDCDLSTIQRMFPVLSLWIFWGNQYILQLLVYLVAYMFVTSQAWSRPALENSSESYVDIKRLSKFENGVVFTDLGNRKVKFLDPFGKTFKNLLGSGQKGASEKTDQTCSFTQVHRICFRGNPCRIGCCCRFDQIGFRTQCNRYRFYKSTDASTTVLSSKLTAQEKLKYPLKMQ